LSVGKIEYKTVFRYNLSCMNKFFLVCCLLTGLVFSMEQSEFFVMGIECRTSNDPEVGPQQIGAHWQKFMQDGVYSLIVNKSSDEIIALYCDYDGDHTQPYSLVIGCKVSSTDEIPEGMVVKLVPQANYAHFPTIGEYPKVLAETWGKVWQSDIKRTYTGDFEVYGEKFYQDPKQVDIFVAVE